jgi:predicted amidohydrolase
VIDYDAVLRGGRVIDPESGLDAVRDVAIAGDRVAAVGVGLPAGRQEADVSGQVVTAGFIDLHSHAHDLGSARLRVTDGSPPRWSWRRESRRWPPPTRWPPPRACR